MRLSAEIILVQTIIILCRGGERSIIGGGGTYSYIRVLHN